MCTTNHKIEHAIFLETASLITMLNLHTIVTSLKLSLTSLDTDIYIH